MIVTSTSKLAGVWAKTTAHVRISTQTPKWDQRGKAKGRTKGNERILKVLPVVAQKKVVAKVTVDLLLLVVTLVLGRQVLEKVGMSTESVGVSSMESTYRTKHETNLLADLLRTRKIVLLAKLGSKVIALQEVHAETGILVIVDGTPKANAQLAANAYFFTAVKQEPFKMPLLKQLQRPIPKLKAKPKQKVKPKLKAKQTPALLRVQ